MISYNNPYKVTLISSISMKFKKFNIKVSLLIKISLLNNFKVKRTIKLKNPLFTASLGLQWDRKTVLMVLMTLSPLNLKILIKSLKVIKFTIKTFKKPMLLIAALPVLRVLVMVVVPVGVAGGALLCEHQWDR